MDSIFSAVNFKCGCRDLDTSPEVSEWPANENILKDNLFFIFTTVHWQSIAFQALLGTTRLTKALKSIILIKGVHRK